MSQFPDQQSGQSMQPRRGMSTGAKIGIGCLVLILLLIIGCVGGIWWAYANYWSVVSTYFDDYTMVSGQDMTVSEPITEPTFYFVQSVAIEADSNSDIAIWAQTSRLKGIVHGEVALVTVQNFVLDEGAIIDGNLHVPLAAQVITIRKGAVITGDITGQAIQNLQIEDGAIIGGQINATIQTTNQASGAVVGQGISPEIRAEIDASRDALPEPIEVPETGGEGEGEGG